MLRELTLQHPEVPPHSNTVTPCPSLRLVCYTNSIRWVSFPRHTPVTGEISIKVISLLHLCESITTSVPPSPAPHKNRSQVELLHWSQRLDFSFLVHFFLSPARGRSLLSTLSLHPLTTHTVSFRELEAVRLPTLRII